MGKRWVVILFCLAAMCTHAQTDSTVKDTAVPQNTVVPKPVVRKKPVTVIRRDTVTRRDTILQLDSTITAPVTALPIDTLKADTVQAPVPVIVKPTYSLLLDSHIYNRQPYFTFTNPAKQLVSKKSWQGKEPFFYAIVALLLFYAIVRNNFGRYSKDLFNLFFHSSIKQKQIKEQMMQAPLPSLLLNILFFITGALFLNLWLNYLNLHGNFGFWPLFLYCVLGLVLIYLIKFISLKICGWVFRVSDATDAYAFIVFTTNKIIGIALLPCIIVMSFATGGFQQAMFTLSLLVVGVLFVYRFVLSYATIHRQVRINMFHFIIYLLAFEIVPLLVINKLLFQFLGQSS